MALVTACRSLPRAFAYVSSCSRPNQKSQRSPEDGDQRGVNGVSVVDVHVVPAALCGKVVEAQPQHRIGTAGKWAQSEQIHLRWVKMTLIIYDIVYDCALKLELKHCFYF